MAVPYLSRRTGSNQWLMQRLSAMFLVGLAFVHFGIQHFTSDAVSTGLTVANRLNNPWWQAYYAVFIVLALYHGVNGLIGILRDYKPRAATRMHLELVIWAIAIFFGARGVLSIAHPVPVTEVKANYAARGFPAGASVGNPPSAAISYDFREEKRELLLLEYYLTKHTHRTDGTAAAEVFAAKAGAAPTPEAFAAAGAAFDAWALAQIRAVPAQDARDRHALFSSSYEFALWALNVRKADALARKDAAVGARLAAVPAYDHVTAH